MNGHLLAIAVPAGKPWDELAASGAKATPCVAVGLFISVSPVLAVLAVY